MGLLDGQVAIVTGASRGIGRFMARELAREGCAIVVAARSERTSDPRFPGTIHEAAAELLALGAPALAVPTDVTSEQDVQRCVERTLAEFGRIDLLVNNAAAFFYEPTLEHPLARFDQTMAVNVRGPWLCTLAVLPTMFAQGRGTVITISSGVAGSAPVRFASYGMSKAAVESMTRCFAAEFGDRGVRCFALRPRGMVDTPGAQQTGLAARASAFEAEDAMGRAAVWLATAPAAQALAGQSLISQHVLERAAR